MSFCSCDKSGDELIFNTFGYLCKGSNKNNKCGGYEKNPTQINLTSTGLHIGKAYKSSQCYLFEEIASCNIVSGRLEQQVKNNNNNNNNNVNDDGDNEQEKSSCCFKIPHKLSDIDKYHLEHGVIIQLIVYKSELSSSIKKLKQRKQVSLLINKNNDFDENMVEAQHLKNKLDPLIINKSHATNKSILIFVNPKSGKGKTIKLLDKIRPILEDYKIKYQLFTTQRPRHALEYVQNHLDLTAYSAIVTVSGDGLLFEVLNGFVQGTEQSRSRRIPIPISIIPGGSGNALACSLNSIYLNGNKATQNQVFNCIMHTIRGQPTPLDIVRIATPNQVYYSFLSFGWGLMADIDIESERLRFLGEPRFTIWSVYRSLALKKYRGTLSYLRKDNVPHSERSLQQHSLDHSSATTNHWVTIDGEFVMVYAAYQKYLNSTVLFAPEAKLDDETIYLLYIKGDVSTCQIIQFLLKLESGLHVKLPFVSFVPVSAFRLVPHGTNDTMTIDGELIPCSEVQAEIIPKMASILLRPS